MGQKQIQKPDSSSVVVNKLKTSEQQEYRQSYLTELEKEFGEQKQEEVIKIETLTTSKTYQIYCKLRKKYFKGIWIAKPVKQFKTLHDIEVALEKKISLLKQLQIIEAIELYESCVKCFITQKFKNPEIFAESLLALAQVIIFANDLAPLHKSAACMLKEAQYIFKTKNISKLLYQVHIQLGYYFLKQKCFSALGEFEEALDILKKNRYGNQLIVQSEEWRLESAIEALPQNKILLEPYYLITLITSMKQTISNAEKTICEEALATANNIYSDNFENQENWIKNAVFSIKDYFAVILFKRGNVLEALEMLQNNLEEEKKLTENTDYEKRTKNLIEKINESQILEMKKNNKEEEKENQIEIEEDRKTESKSAEENISQNESDAENYEIQQLPEVVDV